MRQSIKTWLQLAFLGITVGAVFALPAGASGSTYGQGAYSACGDQASCVTVTTTLSGSQFEVNLTDNQTIPSAGYAVQVAPTGSQPPSFTRVDFYVDGALVYSATPGPDGTANWQWSSPTSGQHSIKIEGYLPGTASPVTQQYTVTVQGTGIIAPVSQAVAQVTAAATSAGAQVSDVTTKATQRAVRQLPAAVVVAFPYLLFVVLGLDLLVLVGQVRQEVAQAEVLEAALDRERAIADDKDTFIRLASHYLRTPVTIVTGSLDLGVATGGLTRDRAEPLKAILSGLHSDVERLLGEAMNVGVITPDDSAAGHARIWLRPGFLVPLVMLGGVALAFNATAVSVGRFSGGFVNVSTQLAIFGLLMVFIYVFVRRRVLRSERRKRQQGLLDEEARVDAAKNQLIHEAATELTSIAEQLRAELPALGNTDTAPSA